MPLDQAEAIVLKTGPIGDQDKLCSFLTRERGVLRGVAKGARKFDNRFGSSLEPMSHVRVFFYEKERHELVTVSNCDLLESFFDIQSDPRTSFALCYFSELVEEFIPVRAGEEVVFRLLLSVLQALRDRGRVSILTPYFEAWILRTHGVLPDMKRCKACRREIVAGGWLSPRRDGVYCENCAPSRRDAVRKELADFLKWVRRNPPPRGDVEGFGPEPMKSIRATLQTLIIYHLEREPRSLRYLKEEGGKDI